MPTSDTAAPSPSEPSAINFDRTWGFTLSADDGSTIEYVLDAAGPFPVSEAPGDPEVVNACVEDEQRDAVLPFKLTRTNRTEGFDADLTLFLNLRIDDEYDGPYLDSGEALSGSGKYGSGVECSAIGRTGSGEGALSLSGILEPGGTGVLPGAFVVHGYYSPDYPDGNEALLDAIYLTVAGLGPAGSGESYDVLNGTGPGGFGEDNDYFTFPLDAT